jgi:hypothetical protein
MIYVRTSWGAYYEDPYRRQLARELGEAWARKTLAEIDRRLTKQRKPRQR